MTCGFVTCDLAVAAQERDDDPKSADHLRKYAKVFRNSPHFKFHFVFMGFMFVWLVPGTGQHPYDMFEAANALDALAEGRLDPQPRLSVGRPALG